jgi:Ca-activated chloride channel homolog
MTFQFAWPWMFAVLPLPYLVWRMMSPLASRRAGAIRLPFFSALERPPDVGRRAPALWRVALLVTGWALLVSASARPQWLGELDQLPDSGRNLMLAVDISGSMNTRDLEFDDEPVDRLTVVKALGTQFLERRVGDRVGLVLFGTQAYLQAPLTFDRQTVATLLDESVIGMAGERTAIGDAIGLALKRLRDLDAEHRVLLLMTDGANTAGNVDPSEAAQLAATAGLRIYTVGIGADRMRVNSLFGTRDVNPSSDLDEALLHYIAETTGGRYFRARSSDALDEVYRLLDQIEPVPQSDLEARRVDDLFHWPLSVLVLAMLGWMIASLPGRAMWAGRRSRASEDLSSRREPGGSS